MKEGSVHGSEPGSRSSPGLKVPSWLYHLRPFLEPFSPSLSTVITPSSSPLFTLLLLLFLYIGNTRKPEKVEYFHPPIRLPLSSLR